MRLSALLPRPTLGAALAFVLATAAPSAAQDLVRPEGWKVRFDREGQSEADLEMFVAMPPGWHVTTGPAGIFWDPGQSAQGDFRLEAEIFLFDPGERREAFGVFFGGTDLDGPGQSYGYFVLREGGEFLVKARSGDETPTLVPWTAHESVLSFAARPEGESSVLNTLAVEARGDRVHFFVNDVEVASVERGAIPVDGVVGLRVNHALNLHVSRLEVLPLGG